MAMRSNSLLQKVPPSLGEKSWTSLVVETGHMKRSLRSTSITKSTKNIKSIRSTRRRRNTKSITPGAKIERIAVRTEKVGRGVVIASTEVAIGTIIAVAEVMRSADINHTHIVKTLKLITHLIIHLANNGDNLQDMRSPRKVIIKTQTTD